MGKREALLCDSEAQTGHGLVLWRQGKFNTGQHGMALCTRAASQHKRAKTLASFFW